MKRRLCFLLCLLLTALCILPTGSSLAETTATIDPGEITAQHALLIDAATGDVLYSKAADEKLYPASTTKLLTCLVILEHAKTDDMVTCGKEVTTFGKQSSLMGLFEGETISIGDLLHGILMVSGNDAAAAAAVYVGGSLDGFAKMMNEKAEELGMDDSHFVNPHGVHDDEHYTTANDMAKVSRVAYSNQTLREIMKLEFYDVPATNKQKSKKLQNTNKLISTQKDDTDKGFVYAYANGMKTGSTVRAENCLVASAEKDSVSLIALLFEDDSKDGVDRWKDCIELFDRGFEALCANTSPAPVQSVVDVFAGLQIAETTDTGKTMQLQAALTADKIEAIPNSIRQMIVNSPENLSAKNNLTTAMTDSLKVGDAVGTVTYYYNNSPVLTADLSVATAVESGGNFPILPVGIGVLVLILLIWFICGMRRAAKQRRYKGRHYRH